MKVRKVLVRSVESGCKKSKDAQKSQKKPGRKTLVRQNDKNVGLVYHHAWKWAASAKRCGISLDDLIAAGKMGLWSGSQKYDPERGMSFASYVTQYIKAYIKCEFDKLSRNQAISLSTVVSENDNGEPVTLEDILPGEDGSIEALENKMRVDGILAYLKTEHFSEFDRKIFQMHHSFGIWEGEKPLSLSALKKELNLQISKEAIRKRINKVTERIRRRFEMEKAGQAVAASGISI